jgi:hypothetical protein
MWALFGAKLTKISTFINRAPSKATTEIKTETKNNQITVIKFCHITETRLKILQSKYSINYFALKIHAPAFKFVHIYGD